MAKQDRPEEREFRIAWQGAEIRIALPAPGPTLYGPDPPRLVPFMADIHPGWRFLSSLSARVLVLLVSPSVEWLKGEEIARALTESEHGKLRHVLTDMAERKLLESGPAGYRLAAPEGVARTEYREALAEYLTREHPPEPDR